MLEKGDASLEEYELSNELLSDDLDPIARGNISERKNFLEQAAEPLDMNCKFRNFYRVS